MSNRMSIGSNTITLVSMDDHGMGRFIRREREKRGLTQAALAAKAGMSRAYLSQIENGKVGLSSADVRRRIAGVIGVRPIDLLVAADELTEAEVSSVAERWPEGERGELHRVVEDIPESRLSYALRVLKAIRNDPEPW